jgi:hypothetical protein
MRIAFLHVVDDAKFKYTENDHRFVHVMLDSVMRTMPNTDIIHLTDESTKCIDGTITIRRPFVHDNPMLFRMEHISAIDGDVLVLDTDVMVRKDLRPIFSLDFDVALTWRSDKVIDTNGVNISDLMPYNTGVVFSRSAKFWKDCVDFATGKNFGWYADQASVAVISERYNTLKLHCDNFNYTPKSASEDVSSRYVVHYKGKRKNFILGEQ